MSELDRITETIEVIAACLDGSDWDALAGVDFVPGDVDPDADPDALASMLSEVQRLQARVEVAMGAIREQLDEAPKLRTATRAYLGHGG